MPAWGPPTSLSAGEEDDVAAGGDRFLDRGLGGEAVRGGVEQRTAADVVDQGKVVLPR